METHVASRQGKEVVIGPGLPTAIIGERINPFGKGPVKEGIMSGDMASIRKAAAEQVEAGADLLVVSVAAFGIEEARILPMAAGAIMEEVDVPLCIETRNAEALEKTLALGCGKPVVSSVTGEEKVLDDLLPLVKRYGTALVVLASDVSGIPKTAEERLNVVRRIVERAAGVGIPRQDIMVDCVAESSAVNDNACRITLDTMRRVYDELGLNLVLGASNASFGLPDRTIVNGVFLALAIGAGLNAAITSPATMKVYTMATDLLTGRDPRARRFTAYYRKRRAGNPS
jgi:5-methyltetrahydrofolate--homocysteine methyltransferase